MYVWTHSKKLKSAAVVLAGVLLLSFAFVTDAAAAKSSKSTKPVMAESTEKTKENTEMKQFMDYIKEKAASGDLETKTDMLAAIQEGEDQFGITLSEQEKEKILDLALKLKGMGFDSEYLAQQAEKLYDEYGAELVEQTQEQVSAVVSEAVNEAVETAANSFWGDVKSALKGLYDSIFS